MEAVQLHYVPDTYTAFLDLARFPPFFYYRLSCTFFLILSNQLLAIKIYFIKISGTSANT